MKKKIDCIIQARLGSNRLKNKILLKVNNKTLLEHLIKRIRKIKNINKIILATTNNIEDEELIKFSIKNKINFFRGSEENVLERVYKTALKFNSKNIFFITSDCPIFDISIANQMIDIYINNDCNFINNNNIRSYPDGMDVQIFSFENLKRSFKNARLNLEKEHVTLYMRKNIKKFKIINLVSPKELYWPKLGLTLDEFKDYILIKKLIKYFSKKNNYFFSCKDAIDAIKKYNWYKINYMVKRKGDT